MTYAGYGAQQLMSRITTDNKEESLSTAPMCMCSDDKIWIWCSAFSIYYAYL